MDLAQSPAAMAPAIGQPHRRTARAAGSGEPVVAGIAVDLEDAVEAVEELFGIFAAAPGRVEVDHAGRIAAAPGTVVAGQCPQPAGLGLAAARIEHRRPRLVHEQLRGLFQVPGQPVGNGPQMERRLADPAGQRRAVQIEARTRVDLRLSVERRMIGVFRHEHMRDGAFGRQPALNQPGRCRRLDDALLATPAGVFGPHGDDHPQLRRHDVQTLAPVLADPVHLPAAARAVPALRLDHPLDPRQVLGQMADIARRRRPFRRRRRLRRRGGFHRLLEFRRRGDEILEGQLPLVGRQLLGPLPVNHPLQLAHQMFETADPLGLCLVPVRQHLVLGAQRVQSGRRLRGRQGRKVNVRKGLHGPVCSTGAQRLPL